MEAAARNARSTPGAPRRRVAGRRSKQWSGAGADAHDPQSLTSMVGRLVADRGWEQPVRQGALFGGWERLVGAGIAAHCRPERLTDGELLVIADSTAWATQLRLLAPKLLARLTGELGSGVVTTLRFQGPVARTRYAGPRRVRGRGLRDTFG